MATTKTPAEKAARTKSAGTKTTTKTAARKATAKKKTIPTISTEQRRCYVEMAAYYIAERRGFTGGGQLEDWVQAEAEIDRLLLEGILKP